MMRWMSNTEIGSTPAKGSSSKTKSGSAALGEAPLCAHPGIAHEGGSTVAGPLQGLREGLCLARQDVRLRGRTVPARILAREE